MIQIRFAQFVGTGNNLLSEPSGIAQLPHPDGRFIIVNDANPQKALFVASMGDSGKLHSQKLDFPIKPGKCEIRSRGAARDVFLVWEFKG